MVLWRPSAAVMVGRRYRAVYHAGTRAGQQRTFQVISRQTTRKGQLLQVYNDAVDGPRRYYEHNLTEVEVAEEEEE